MDENEIRKYKDNLADNLDINDKRHLTHSMLFSKVVPIESDPRFEYLNSTDQESDTVELEMHDNPHDTKVAEIHIKSEDNTTNDNNKATIIFAFICIVLSAGAYLKGRYDEHKRQKEKPES